MKNPFRYFNCSPDVIRLTVMLYIRYPLSLRQVEDILFERGIDICHETVRLWWNRFGPMFAAVIRNGGFNTGTTRFGGGTSMRCTCGSMASRIIYGPQLIGRVRCSRSLPRNAGIVRPHSIF
jgi:hypothetical protein